MKPTVPGNEEIIWKRIKILLNNIYGTKTGNLAFRRIAPILEKFTPRAQSRQSFFSHRDVALITYGDTLRNMDEAPLATMRRFTGQYLKGTVSIIHFLPFFPYSSDDGFSVVDFLSIEPKLGTWEDVSAFSTNFNLMFDFVINHFSSQSRWFHSFLDGEKGYEDFVITEDPDTDLSMVIRPRSHPLLTPYEMANGSIKYVWTTFSADQIDFNYHSLDVLEKIIRILLFYVEKGADVFRLDAIAYLWKEIGTSCIHLPQTHEMVKLFRAVLDMTAPDVMLLTETNVPHEENISYFGNGSDESQIVYNFTLPPLLLHTFTNADATALSQWAGQLELTSETNTFLNFTASHDGIGVRPLEGILSPEKIDALCQKVKTNGGQVSYRRMPDGGQSPYELNIAYVDALHATDRDLHIQKFLASQAIQYVLPGIPATYIHSLLGSRNWYEGVKLTGRARSINRQPLQYEEVISDLEDPGSFRSRIFTRYLNLIKTRIKHTAFHPKAGFAVISLGPKVFCLKRCDNSETIYAVTNISPETLSIDCSALSCRDSMVDLISAKRTPIKPLVLAPYQYVWLTN